MGNILINESKCIMCSKCIRVCPTKALSEAANKIIVKRPDLCVSCGHCAAICPNQSISSSDSNVRNPFTIKALPTTLNADQRIFHEKRSEREFKNDSIPKHLLNSLVEYAEKAPSSHNFRNRRYYVITDRQKIKDMERLVVNTYKFVCRLLNPIVLKVISIFGGPQVAKELHELSLGFTDLIKEYNEVRSPVFRDAQCVVCIAALSGSVQSKDDCLAAQQYMMLYGHTQGLGSCVIGYAQYAHKVIEKYLKLPNGYSVFAISIFGFPLYAYQNEICYSKSPQVFYI